MKDVKKKTIDRRFTNKVFNEWFSKFTNELYNFVLKNTLVVSI